MNFPIPSRHTPALLLATTFTFGGLWPLWNPRGATEEFGLPPRIANSPEANPVFAVYGSRMTCMGLMLGIFYYRRMYAAIDVLLGTLGWAGVVDGLVCWREGVSGRAVFRAVAGAGVAAVGWFGVTAGS